MSNEHTLWMGDLEVYMDERFIFQAFEQMGESVIRVKLMNNKQSRNPAGYCFVDFSSADAAQRAMLKLNGKVIPGTAPPKRFKLNYASFGREHLANPEFSLFVGDVSEDLDDYSLFNIFASKYLSCKSANIVLDSNGKSRGYGFVRFACETEQQTALIEMQGYAGANVKPLRISLATPKRSHSQNSSQSSTPATPHSYYQQHYYPNYQPFYNSAAAAWWAAYQQPNTGYYYGQYPDSSYGYSAQQYYDSSAYSTDETDMSAAKEQNTEDSDEVEDPVVADDVQKCNMEFMQQNEELYEEIEKSRWHLMDDVYAKVVTST